MTISAWEKKWSQGSDEDVTVTAAKNNQVPPISASATEQLLHVQNLRGLIARAVASQQQVAALKSEPNPLSTSVPDAVPAFESFLTPGNKSQ